MAGVKTTQPFHCLGCKTVLAATDGGTLYSGNFSITRTVTLCCAGCGKLRVWKPVVIMKAA